MKFDKLSPTNRLIIQDMSYKLYSQGKDIKDIRSNIYNEMGYKLPKKELKRLIHSKQRFNEFEMLIQTKNLIY